jgi:cytochrome oxidase assembly protein ShyY1
MYRFALRPRWLIAHVAVVALAAAFVWLGLWQLRRLSDQRAHEAVVAARMRQQPATSLAGATAYRRVSASGTYRTADETLLFGRAFDGRPGHHVLTWLDGETHVLVDRGWVPYTNGTPPVRGATPPSDPVRVEGVLVPSEHGGVLRDGRTTTVNVERLAKARGVGSVPYYVLLQRQDPAQPGELPVPVPWRATHTAPPHLSYAIQWFAFTAIGLVGYAFVLRRAAARV